MQATDVVRTAATGTTGGTGGGNAAGGGGAMDPVHTRLFNESIRGVFKDALRVSLKDPGLAFFVLRAIRAQNRAARVRSAWEERGVHVPPVMIVSVTSRCNLQCKGCYAHAQNRCLDAEMSESKLRSVIKQARELGVSIILIAGGEPLVRPDILYITADFPDIIFPIFTNGLLINEDTVMQLKNQRNVIPVISLEGYEDETDQRRGRGVYQHLTCTIKAMNDHGLFFGTSLTVTARNLDTVTDRCFIGGLLAAGCRAFFFVEYVPIQPGTEDLVLGDEQRATALAAVASLRSELPGLFIAFPGDEKEFGGCLAAGRGFVHVSAAGNVEPCPFAPFSDASLVDMPLKDALRSRFLREIRSSGEHLSETAGGCALWARREWVRSLLGPGPGGNDIRVGR